MHLPLPFPEPDLAHERSNAILRFVARNQIATNQTLHQVLFPTVTKTTAQKLIVRLINRGLLKRWPLHASKSYLRLGASAIARWRYPASLSRRLGPQVLPYLLGTLSLMSHSYPSHERLLASELEEHFPGFPKSRDLHQWAYYRDNKDEHNQLATVRVEYRVGGEIVIAKVMEQFHRYRQYECFNRLLEEGRLILHVVTATVEQERSLWEAADRLGFPAQLRTAHDNSLTLFL